MSVKRIFSLLQAKHRTCLKCGAAIGKNDLVDNQLYICPECGQRHLVDIIGTRCGLTRLENESIRHRPAASEIEYLQEEVERWKAAAEGLAKVIEDITEKNTSISTKKSKM